MVIRFMRPGVCRGEGRNERSAAADLVHVHAVGVAAAVAASAFCTLKSALPPMVSGTSSMRATGISCSLVSTAM